MSKARIIVLAGQSNAVGVGHTKYLKDHFDSELIDRFYKGYDNVLINYSSHGIKSNGFVKTTVNCTEAAKDTCGPELGIAKSLAERSNDTFYIVKCAFGGTNLCNDWLSPSCGAPYSADAVGADCSDIIDAMNNGRPIPAGRCYNELISLLRESIAVLKAEGKQPEIRAFFWMQGESDAQAMVHVEKYEWRYDNLLADFKAEFAEYLDNCTYVDGGISDRWLHYKEMNAIKRDYAARCGYQYLDTIAAGLTTEKEPIEEPDWAHYDVDSTIKLGELFAERLRL